MNRARSPGSECAAGGRYGALKPALEPDLVICDGQGRAHPRRMGLACHLGLWLDVPTIGCAKSRLIGTHREPGLRRGCHTRLLDRGEVVGEVVRTRNGVKPVFVSVGHRISLPSARAWTLKLARYRVPEPVRAAHLEADRLRRRAASGDRSVSTHDSAACGGVAVRATRAGPG